MLRFRTMPELPDITVYVERLRAFTVGQPLVSIRVASPFLVRTYDPKLSVAHGRVVQQVDRIGKRLHWVLDRDLHLVLHLMIAGRLRWKSPGASIRGRSTLASFDFPNGSLVLTEASKKKRASLHLVRGDSGLAELDRGGLSVHTATGEQFADAVTRERHTLKRTLTDPRILDGIGNAYSDEILHHACLSPVRMSTALSTEELERLRQSCVAVLDRFTDVIRAEVGDGFPDVVTAFRPDMAVHGRYRKPCPRCSSPVQRIVRGESETNYCPTCQTGGKLLADRALSRLLKSDWPATLAELEDKRSR